MFRKLFKKRREKHFPHAPDIWEGKYFSLLFLKFIRESRSPGESAEN